MHQLKYRAWDKINKKMLPSFTLSDLADGDCGPSTWTEPFIAGLSPEHYDIMQFIGAKDGNETEIYDGDILMFSNGEHALVNWNDKEFRWELSYMALSLQPAKAINAIVVGTKYDKKLLKKTL